MSNKCLAVNTKYIIYNHIYILLSLIFFSQGATVIVHGSVWDEANAKCLEAAQESGKCLKFIVLLFEIILLFA